ncbi:MAG: hypothetical protein AB7F31_04725 [Parachlamydiales bacterium]
MGGVTLLDGQFLEQAGTGLLPLTYFWTAGALFVTASLLLWAMNRASPKLLFTGVLVGTALFYGMVSLVTRLPLGPQSWVVLKVAADALFLTILTSLWTSIDRAYDLQDGKRLFGLFSAALILGAAAGSGWVAVGLPVVGVGGIAASFGVAVIVAALMSLRCPSEGLDKEEVKEEVGWRPLIQQVFSSRFTLYLLFFNILLGLIEVVCEFDYMSTLTQVLGEGDMAVTRFLGRARGWVYVGDMAFGMFLYSRLIKRIGINNASLCSAGYFLTLFIAGPPLNGLFIAILGLIAAEGILPVLEDSNFNLLINAVPKGVRTRFRITCDLFLQPIGMLCGSLLLALFQSHVKVVGLALALLAVGVALLIRHRYPRAIYDNLAEEGILLGQSAGAYLGALPAKERKRLPGHLLARLPKLSVAGQVGAIECLLHLSRERPLSQLLEGLGKLSEGALPEALTLLERTSLAGHEAVLEEIEGWTDERRSERCRGRALLYLARWGRFPDRGTLSANCPYLRGGAILQVLRQKGHPQRELAYTLLRRLAASQREEEVLVALQLLGALASPRDVAFLSRFLSHPSSSVVKRAVEMLARVPDLEGPQLESIGQLLASTRSNRVRLACFDALEGRLPRGQVETLLRIAPRLCPQQRRRGEALILQLGTPIAPRLQEIASDPSRDYAQRISSCRILAQMGLALPHALLAEELEQAAFYYYHHHTCQESGHLQDLLRLGYENAVDLIVHLLCCSQHDADLLCRALRSGDEKTHSNAVETIEKRSPPKLSELILLLIDDRPISEKLKLYRKRGGRILSGAQLTLHFARSPKPFERLVADMLSAERDEALQELAFA